MTASVRALALELLEKCEKSGAYSTIVLDGALRSSPLSPEDRGLLTALFYGVLGRRLTLDYIIDTFSALPPEKIDARTRAILRLGLYQLRYMDKIPPHAAVNESVNLCTRKNAGFVNALLRAYLRQNGEVAFPTADGAADVYLSVKYSICPALCREFLSFYSLEQTETLFSAFERREKGLTLRVNTLRTDKETLSARLRALGAEVTACRDGLSGLYVEGVPISRLPMDAGDFFVQDEASQLCVAALDARPGETVIDACACPGSKSFGAAMDMQNRGRVLSFDLHENKLSLVRRGAERLGLTILRAAARDGRSFDASLEGVADRVLCDVPCSGFGVLAKKPEIRYKDPQESVPLPDIQLAILENNSRYVRPGGVLVYSTCTLLPRENGENVARFLARHPEFAPEPFSVGGLCAPDGRLTLTPHEHGTDGFFIAKMKRKG